MARIRAHDPIGSSFTVTRSSVGRPAEKPGLMPNVLRVMAIRPATSGDYIGLGDTPEWRSFALGARERIALAVAEVNACNYRLAEITPNRKGASDDTSADATARFVAKISHDCGHVAGANFEAVKVAGYDDAQAIEIIPLVAINTLLRYLNAVVKTDITKPKESIRTYQAA